MRTSRSTSLAVLGALLASAVTILAGSPAQAGAATTTAAAADLRMPSEVPSGATPWVRDGEVQKLALVGNTMVAGGTFSSVTGPSGSPTYARTNIFAFNATSGAVSTTFVPQLNGAVNTVLPGPQPNTVYVGGTFNSANGATASRIALLNVTTGQLVTSFKAPTMNGQVQALAVHGNRLFVAGYFTKVGGVDHGGLATLNASTGALDPFVGIDVAGHHNNTGGGAQGGVGGREIAITPDGSRMVVIGNFKTADGLPRDQVLVANLGATSAQVAPDWSTNRYTPYCFNWAFDSYMRGLAMSADGTYFVVTATGGHNNGTLCDTAARWETFGTGLTQQPTWVADAGGDTLWGVAVTDAAVYVGGHSRWMNNPNGSDSAGQGAVPRAGLAALDPHTGVPLDWNPGRNPRGEAAYSFLPTDNGVWMTSNTNFVGNRQYRRERIAFFPYAGGTTVAPDNTATLPGTIVVGGAAQASNVLYRINAGGDTLLSDDGGPDWAADIDAASPFRTSGSNSAGWSDITAVTPNVPAGTPTRLFSSERWDPDGGPDMDWAFPVAVDEQIQVRVYLANRCDCTSAVGSRRFNLSVDGVTRLANYDIVADVGDQRGTVKTFDIVSDGTVDLHFSHVQENPLVNGIEIVRSGAVQPSPQGVVARLFDGSQVSESVTLPSDVNWSTARGATMVGQDVYYGGSDGMLYKRSFDGAAFGPAVAIDPYRDPAWAGVDTGSNSTYDGRLPTWYGQLNRVTGLAYADHRLYYTLSGDNSLYWRSFVPDSGIVSPIANTLSGGFTWSRAQGMFIDGNQLYVVSSADGSLNRVTLDAGAPVGVSSVVNSAATGGVDWRGRALFLSTVRPAEPNLPPTARFQVDCADLTCDFDASGSDDPDGNVTSYTWTFGDDSVAGGQTARHTFATTGTYRVSLTVTDNQGASATTSSDVVVASVPVPDTISFVDSQIAVANSKKPTVRIPATIVAGDRLVLAVTVNNLNSALPDPAGWTRLDAAEIKTMGTTVWTKTATAGDAGSNVSLTLDAAAKHTITVSGYRGATGGVTANERTDGATGTQRSTPAVNAPAGSWVVSYWADKSATTSSWTPGGGVTGRASACAEGPGHICSLLADSSGPVPGGTYGNIVASTDEPSGMATIWSIVLRP